MKSSYAVQCGNPGALAAFVLRLLLAATLGLAAMATPALAAAPAIDSIVVKLRDGALANPAGGLTHDEQAALFDELQTPFSHVGYTHDGALQLRLSNPLPLDAARAAVNRVRMLPQVLYANVVPSAPDGTNAANAPQAQPMVRRMIVKFRDAATTAAAQRGEALPAPQVDRLSEKGGQPLGHERAMSGGAFVMRLFQALSVEQARTLAASLAADPAIEYAEPDILMRPQLVPNDPSYASQWHYKSPPAEPGGANLPSAWDLTTGAASVVVAVIDTGSLPLHPDLAGRFIGGYDFISEDFISQGVTQPLTANDGDGRDADPADPGDWVTAAENASGFFAGCGASNSSFHGSHVAGTIGAATGNGTGVAGINWVSKILPARVLGKCGGYLSDIADAIRWSAGGSVPDVPANANPARVLNLSLGGGGPCGNTMQDAINAALAANAVVVVAAGNGNANASGFTPGNCNGVITVAATGRAGQRAAYSNYGATVEISAPGGADGQSVLSTINTGATSPLAGGYSYGYKQGTSMATPHVAGIASLMLSRNPALTPSEVVAKIQTTARAFPTGTGRDCTTALCGAGIIDAAVAVLSAGGGQPVATTTTLTSVPNPAALGATVIFTATVNGSTPGGRVSFAADGGPPLAGCSAVALTGTGNSRTATCPNSSLAVGVHSIIASYGGDVVNAASSSVALSQVITGTSTVWVDDAVPAGATAGGAGESWTWVASNPSPYAGGLAHQSGLVSGLHQHYFYAASATLAVGVGDSLFAYVYLDPANPPREVMLQWHDGTWDHRAYWGENLIPWGTDGSASRRYMGALPATGQWVRLEVTAAQVGLEGRTLNGMAYTLYDGRATWDYAGKAAAAALPTYQVSGTVMVGATALGGVSFAAGGGASCSNSNGAGQYACTVPQGWSGTVTPTLTGYSFTPPSRSYSNVVANQSAQDYAAAVIVAPAWVDDAVPAGATAGGAGESWTWVASNPSPYAGGLAHQSGLVGGMHQHYFYAASATLAVGVGDSLFAYVYLDPANPPREVMLQWHDGTWDHRAYWGENLIPWGTDGSASRRYMGELPATGQWVRLEVTAAQVGLEGRTLNGMAYTLYDGRATWDYAGKAAAAALPTYQVSGTVMVGATALGGVSFAAGGGASCSNSNGAGQYACTVPQGWSGTVTPTLTGYSFTPPSRSYSNVVANQSAQDYAAAVIVAPAWVDDAVPAGATAGGAGESWTWVASNPSPYAGGLAHQSGLVGGMHQHYFYAASATLAVGVGDSLFAYVYLDPANPPREVMLQWHDGTWDHRAYWGENLIPWGTDGSASRRYMGELPATGQWVRLEVMAAQVGLEGRTLNGMAYTLYDGRATWDYAGKAAAAALPTYQVSGTVMVGATALGGVSFAAGGGASCSNSNGAGQYACTVPQGWSGTVTPTLTGYSFTPPSRSYSNVVANQSAQDYAAAVIVAPAWVDDAVPAGATAGGAGESWTWVASNPSPYAGGLAHQSGLVGGMHQHYFYAASATLAVGVGDSLFAYVYLDPANPPREVMLQWHDGTWDHRAYWGENLIPWGTDGSASRRYMGELPATGQWVRLEVMAAQVGLEGRTVSGMAYTLYDGRATWDYAGKVANIRPAVSLTAPANGSTYTAPATVAISANASDIDGSISHVEFYWGMTLIGNATTAPYGFSWTNVPVGTYSLTATAYDNLGASTVSEPVTITVNPTAGTSTAPNRPTVTQDPSSILVSWDNVNNASSYVVYYTYDPASPPANPSYPSATNAIDIPLGNFPSLRSLYFAVAPIVNGVQMQTSQWAYLANFDQIDLGFTGDLAIAIADINNDGCVEVLGTLNDCTGNLLPQPYGSIGLAEAVPPARSYSHARPADFNGDGIPDLIVNGYAAVNDPSSTVLLYYGNGDGTFTKATSAQFPAIYRGYGETIVVADFDNDGHLDIFLPNYTHSSPQEQNYLLRNRGDGTFVEIADAAGVANRGWPLAYKVEGAQALDFNGDGFLDLYTGSRLYINNGDMTFSDRRAEYGLPMHYDEGAKLFDWNNDGYIDLLLHHPENGPALFQFDGRSFSPVSGAFPNGYYEAAYGMNAEDVDGDGFMDVQIAGGTNADGSWKSASLFLKRNNQYVLTDLLSAPSGFGDISGFADFDRNGTMDMILRSLLTTRYLKSTATDSSAVKVFMYDANGAQNQHGRAIRATPARDPGFIMTRIVDGGSGYLANGEYGVTFPTPKGDQYWVSAQFDNRIVGGWVGAGSVVKIYRDGRFLVTAR